MKLWDKGISIDQFIEKFTIGNDPRRWLREGEKAFISRLKKAFEDLNNVDTL